MRQGDGRTPEGFYQAEFGYDSPNWWMWIDLDHPGAQGRVGVGSAFKLCLDYPNAVDRARSARAGAARPGSAICLHGNCVSAGCASMASRDFLPVFAFARHHDRRRAGRLQVHVFPFRFDRPQDLAARAAAASAATGLPAAELRAGWRELQQGFARFEARPRPLAVRVRGGRYVFE
ncbi:MAG: hypothetical protein QM767_07065 [Anaeromyxobacter sp.]